MTAQTITPVSQSSDTGDNLGRTVGRALSCVQNEGHSHGEEEGKESRFDGDYCCDREKTVNLSAAVKTLRGRREKGGEGGLRKRGKEGRRNVIHMTEIGMTPGKRSHPL